MDGWTARFFKSTRGKVVELLRRKSASVSDLAGELDLTDNAVRAHLTTLERDGLIEQSGSRSSARRPETLYSLSRSAENLFPKSYHALLNSLMDVLEEDHSPEEIRNILKSVGRRMVGDKLDELRSEDLPARIGVAAALVEDIGGLAEIHETPESYTIQGFSCPFGAAVCHNRDVCVVIESMLATLTGERVLEQCDHSDRPRCNFSILKPEGNLPPTGPDSRS